MISPVEYAESVANFGCDPLPCGPGRDGDPPALSSACEDPKFRGRARNSQSRAARLATDVDPRHGVFREEITWSTVAHVLARRKQERAVAPRQGLFAGDSKVAARRLVAANRGQERLAHRKQLGHPRPRERRS
ncbi:hypothetical protein MRX96_020922 [Rhipicephalus microplus]